MRFLLFIIAFILSSFSVFSQLAYQQAGVGNPSSTELLAGQPEKPVLVSDDGEDDLLGGAGNENGAGTNSLPVGDAFGILFVLALGYGLIQRKLYRD